LRGKNCLHEDLEGIVCITVNTTSTLECDRRYTVRYFLTEHTFSTFRSNLTFNLTCSLKESFYLHKYYCPACSSPKEDIIFVIDGSKTVGRYNFDEVKSFVQSTVETFDASNEKVRVSVIQFSSPAVIEFDLLRYTSKQDVISAVGRIQYHNGGQRTSVWLTTVQA